MGNIIKRRDFVGEEIWAAHCKESEHQEIAQ